MANTHKKSTKTLAVITYVIAFVCLLAGLLLPFGPVKTEKTAEAMLVTQIPQALKCLGIKFDKGNALLYSYPVTLWGGKEFDIGALFVLLYALVCVVALIALVPVLTGKKDKDTSIKSAGFIEVLSTIVVSVLLFMEMMTFSQIGAFLPSGYELGNLWSLALVVAFSGPLLMLIVQSVAHRGSSGFVKAFLTVLSGLAIVLCLFSVSAIAPKLADKFEKTFKGNYQLIDWTDADASLGSIWYHLDIPFRDNYLDVLKELGGKDAALSATILLLGVMIIINFFIDVCGLNKTTKRGMLLANLIRYILELVLALGVLILGGFVNKHDIGLICYAIVALSALSAIINIIRYATFKDAKKKAPKKQKATYDDAYLPQEPAPMPYASTSYTEPAPIQEKKPEPAPVQEKKPEPAPVQPKASQQKAPAKQAPAAAQNGNVYSPVIYSGPHDGFIDTLSNEERVEFARTFIERRNGAIPGIPEYVVDGNNEKFFQSLFIYYSRVRGLVSDGLMNKFYVQIKALNN